MSLLCPNCEKTNKCDCKTCNPDGNATDLIIILEQEQLYQCCFCSHKFNEQDSLDLEWDRMHEDFKNNITPEMCITWNSFVLVKERKEYLCSLKEHGYVSKYGDYGFESAFFQHFGIRHDKCGYENLNKLKIQLDRDNKISKLIQTNI